MIQVNTRVCFFVKGPDLLETSLVVFIYCVVYVQYCVWCKEVLDQFKGKVYTESPVCVENMDGQWTVRLLPFSTQYRLRNISHNSVSPMTWPFSTLWICSLKWTQFTMIINLKRVEFSARKNLYWNLSVLWSSTFWTVSPKVLYLLVWSRGDELFPTNRGSRVWGHSWRSVQEDLVVSQGNGANKLQGWS